MKIKNLLNLFFGFFLMLNVSACNSGQNWQGKYSFTAEFGENVAETPVIVDYELTINDGTCALSIIGYQIADDILCEAKTDQQNKLNILFKSYADGSLTSFYPAQIYQVGELLFSMSREDTGLITEWGSLIVDNPFAKRGRYFKKQ